MSNEQRLRLVTEVQDRGVYHLPIPDLSRVTEDTAPKGELVLAGEIRFVDGRRFALLVDDNRDWFTFKRAP